MDAVVVETETDHERIHAEDTFERTDDRDRAAAADNRRLLPPLIGKRSAGAPEIGTVEGQLQRRAAAMGAKIDLAVGWDPFADKGAEALAQAIGSLVADQPEGDLGRGLRGNDRLEAVADVAADDAVHLAGRPRPDLFEDRATGLAGGNRQSDVAQEFPAVEIERIPLCLDVGGHFADAVVEAGDHDATFPVVERREDLGKDVDRIARSAAIAAGVEIAIGRRDDDLLADET